MSESQENIEDVFEDGAEIDAQDDKQEIEHDDKPEALGYMSKEAWVASGKNPDEWVSEDVFNERGERIKQTAALRREINGQRREFDNQIKNLNLFHQVQIKNQRDELLLKRDDAIDIADKAEVKRLDRKIKDLDDVENLAKKQEVASPAKAPEIAEWEADNPWCNNPDDPRLKFAQSVFDGAIKQGKTTAGALRLVDRELSAKFSEKSGSPRQLVEGSRTSGGKRDDSSSITMKTLTRSEQQAWDSGLFDDEKAFLKAVANDRKGAK